MKISDYFKPLDYKKLDVWHIKSLLTTGMGVFTDGYDLASIGIVLTAVLTSFGISPDSPDKALWVSLLTASALISSIIGALVFGWLSNKGRKTFYGIDVAILTVGAVLQAFVQTPLQLVIVRAILGFGIGADYVLSPTILAEHSNAKDRGKLLALGFGLMWGFGATTAAAIALALDAFHVPSDIVWRVVLAAGAIPAASVIYLRRKMPETPRYLLRIKGDVKEFKEVVNTLAKTNVEKVDGNVKDTRSFSEYFTRFWRVFLAATILWFFFSMISYAGILFGPSYIAKSVGINSGALFQIIIEAAFILPGGIIALLTLDRVGRKPMQVLGFIGMGAALLLFAMLRTSVPALMALIIYGMYALFMQAGPGSVSATGLLGVELAPTKVRGLVQGLTVTGSRIGATLTAFVFPYFSILYGQSFAITFLGIAAITAAVLTFVLIPETKGKPLEVASSEEAVEVRQ